MSGVSAIMVSWQTGPVLLTSIEALLSDADIDEIILVDHENPPELRAELDRLAAGNETLTIIQTDENLGFAKGCNLGAAKAGGKMIFFINPDARPAPGAVRHLQGALDGQPAEAIAGARILGEDGKEQSGSRRRELTLWRAFVTFTGIAAAGLAVPFGREHESVPSQPVRVDAISGAGFMISKTGFEALGGFDEGYFLHVEDIDLCRRADVVWFVPDSVIHHIGGTSGASALAVEWAKTKSFVRYFWKFDRSIAGRAATIIAAPFLALAIMMRAVVRR